MQTIDELLTGVPAFEGLGRERLELIAGCAVNRVFQDGDYLLREGEPADAFYVIRHGGVALETYVPNRGALTLETCTRASSWAGRGWCRRTAPRSTRARPEPRARWPSTDGACAASARPTPPSATTCCRASCR